MLRPFYPRERPGAGVWASGSAWTSWKLSLSPGLDPPTVQSVASRQTNYDISLWRFGFNSRAVYVEFMVE